MNNILNLIITEFVNENDMSKVDFIVASAACSSVLSKNMSYV